MRISTVLLAAAVALTAPTMALAAKKKDAPADLNANTKKFLSDGFHQLFVPIKSLTATAAEPAKKAKKSKKKKKKK